MPLEGDYVPPAAKQYGDAENSSTPLVLDLDGDGLDLVALSDSRVFFDMDNDGFAERTAWVAPDDALLALDRDGNGRIDNQAELFGGTPTDGFASLRTLDGNNDGRVDAADADFAALRLWRDLDGDGISKAVEMQSLADAGITSLSLASTRVTQTVAGNAVTDLSTYTRTDGTSATLADVWFTTNARFTFDVREVELDLEALLLPTLRGYGTISSLTAEMSRDATLLQMVKDFAAAPLGADTDARVRAILHRWAGVEEVDPTSRGPNADARDLAFLEKFFDDPFNEHVWNSPDPPPQAKALLAASFGTVLDAVKARLIVQGPLADLFGPGAFDYLSDTLRATGSMETLLADLVAEAPGRFAGLPAGLAGSMELCATLVPVLDEVAAGSGLDTAAYGAAANAAVRALTGFGFAAADFKEPAWTPIAGTDAAETLAGGAGNRVDLFLSSAGNDRLEGGGGADVYTYANNGGHDTIVEGWGWKEVDRLVLGADLTSTSARFLRDGDSHHFKLAFAGAVGTVTVVDGFYGSDYGVEQVQFGDGVVWGQAEFRDAYIRGAQTAGNDTVHGFRGDTVFRVDALAGHDRILDSHWEGGGGDTLVLGPGLASTGLTVTRSANGYDAKLGFAGAAGSLTLVDTFYGGNSGVDQVRFSDGTVWGRTELGNAYLAQAQTAGNDTIQGFGGGTTFAVGTLAGHDTVVALTANADRVVFGAGLLSTEVVVTRSASGNDAKLAFAGKAGSLTLRDEFWGGNWGVEQVQFGDGVVWGRADLLNACIA